MPFIRVTVSDHAASDHQLQEVGKRIGEAIAETMGKRADVTSVLVERNPTRSWMVGGTLQTQAAVVQAFVTLGTNSASEKSRFIARTNEILRDSFGNLHNSTYVIISEVPADTWGYDGKTQRDRSVATDQIVLTPEG